MKPPMNADERRFLVGLFYFGERNEINEKASRRGAEIAEFFHSYFSSASLREAKTLATTQRNRSHPSKKKGPQIARITRIKREEHCWRGHCNSDLSFPFLFV